MIARIEIILGNHGPLARRICWMTEGVSDFG